jgi:hypothetical protein
MNKPSSNKQVENKLDILYTVQKVSAPEGMYDSLLAKIESQKKNAISITWMRSAAAAIFILIAIEAYVVITNSFPFNKENTSSIESIIPESNNLLYND